MTGYDSCVQDKCSGHKTIKKHTFFGGYDKQFKGEKTNANLTYRHIEYTFYYVNEIKTHCMIKGGCNKRN